MKAIFQVQKKRAGSETWVSVSQCYCQPEDIRRLIHSVATDNVTRVVKMQQLDAHLPLYNFTPPGTMTKIHA